MSDAPDPIPFDGQLVSRTSERTTQTLYIPFRRDSFTKEWWGGCPNKSLSTVQEDLKWAREDGNETRIYSIQIPTT